MCPQDFGFAAHNDCKINGINIQNILNEDDIFEQTCKQMVVIKQSKMIKKEANK